MDGFSLRLFVAIELPADVREALAATIERLRRLEGMGGLRWVRPEGIHITLKFLGSVHEADLPGINTALVEALTGASSFDLRTGHLGSFGGKRTLRVIWLGLDGDLEAFAELAGRAEAACEPLGFKRESRPFAAHLTLARVRDDVPADQRAGIHELILGEAVPEATIFHVNRCSLMQSTLKAGGAVYNALATYPLVDAR